MTKVVGKKRKMVIEPKYRGRVYQSDLQKNVCKCGREVISHCYQTKEGEMAALGQCQKCGNIYYAVIETPITIYE